MASRTRSLGGNKFVGFVVGEVRYAVDIQRVAVILKPLPVVPLPHMPSSVTGVFSHRGRIVPVIDLRLRYGLVAASQRSVRWVVVNRGSGYAALVVDAVEDVFGADAQSHRQAPHVGDGDAARAIVAAYSYGHGLVFEVDLDRLTAQADAVDVTAAALALPGETR